MCLPVSKNFISVENEIQWKKCQGGELPLKKENVSGPRRCPVKGKTVLEVHGLEEQSRKSPSPGDSSSFAQIEETVSHSKGKSPSTRMRS